MEDERKDGKTNSADKKTQTGGSTRLMTSKTSKSAQFISRPAASKNIRLSDWLTAIKVDYQQDWLPEMFVTKKKR